MRISLIGEGGTPIRVTSYHRNGEGEAFHLGVAIQPMTRDGTILLRVLTRDGAARYVPLKLG